MVSKSSGLYFEQGVPSKVHRRDLTAKVRKRRICVDDRNYVPIAFTIPSTNIGPGDYAPMFPIDRELWVAKVTAECGLHDSGSHPADGAAVDEITINIRVVSADLSTDTALISSDSRLRIAQDEHQDTITNGTDLGWSGSNFNFRTLEPGMHIYVRIVNHNAETGGTLVVTFWGVPVRFSE